MTRLHIALVALGAILLVVVFWLLLWSPQQDELQQVRDDTEAARDQQQALVADRDRLRAVREEAPEVEAELAAASAVVPSEPALPSALRQLQQAADDSGALLQAVSPSRPSQIEEADLGVSSIELNIQVEGGYFQLVDFLRRIEDPALTPRGIVWTNLTLAREDEYPSLTASISGAMFTRLPGPPTDEPEDLEDEVDEDDEGDDENDVDDDDADDADADVDDGEQLQ